MTPFTESDLAAVGREAARSAWDGGMTVLREGTFVPIPLVAEPVVYPAATLAALAREAHAILSGAVKLARALLARGDARDRAALLGPFTGLEAEAMERLFDEAPCPVVMARVDFLPAAEGVELPRALELNATIPAMSGYSDLVAHAWLRAAARARGKTPRQADELVAAAGSNMERLRRALCAFAVGRGVARARPSIAVVSRPADSQTGELGRLVEHLRQMGHPAEHLTPDACDPACWDVLYRHVWAHKTPPESPFAAALRHPARFVLANPVNGMLEAKALFARLSEAGADRSLADLAGLDEAERGAAGRLPFTRRLEPALAPRLLAERERWVLKRSWDYGGKSVHLGAELSPEAWRATVESALGDERGGGFVAQERIVAERRPATRVTPDGLERAPLYHDVSTYCGLGPCAPTGSVVRAAASPIVNLLGGGGLAPVLSEEVIERLG